jgi:protein gp37
MREVVGRVEWAKDLLSHIWLGVTVENQAMADERIPILLQTPAKVRWLSVEPMLGEITARWAKWVDYKATIKAQGRIFHLEGLKRLDWVVIGCESGVNRRPCKLEWVRSLVAQCTEAQVPVWVKQLEINGKVVQDVSKFPADLQIRELPNG